MQKHSWNRYLAALATTTALVGAGMAVPTAFAEDAVNTATGNVSSEPVDGFSWEKAEVVAGGKVELKPSTSPSDAYRFSGPRDGLGFTFTTDAKTGVVTAEAAVNKQPGEGVTFSIGVHKLNADKTAYEKVGEYSTTVTVKAGGTNHANNYEMSYDAVVVRQKSSAIANNKADRMPQGTTFAVAHTPEGYSVSVDGWGNVTVTPGENLGPGSTATARIKVQYPDTSFEYADVDITVADEKGNTTPLTERDSAKYEPAWSKGELKGDKGASATSELTSELPAGTSFKLREDLFGDLLEYFDVALEGANVKVTTKAALNPVSFNVPVEVTYPDGSAETRQAAFAVTEAGQLQAQKAKVSYPAINTPADQAGESTPAKTDVPAGTKFSSANQLPAGWTFSVDEATGKVTAQAPENSPGGMSATLHVNATFPDGSSDRYPVEFKTTDPSSKLAAEHTVTYDNSSVTAGNSVTVKPKVSPAAPAGTKFSGPKEDVNGISIAVAENGDVTVTAGAQAPNANLTIPVTVRYPDGSSTKVEAVVAVKAAAASTTSKPSTTAPATSTTPTSAAPTSQVPTPATSTTPVSSTTSAASPTSTTGAAPTKTTPATPEPDRTFAWNDVEVVAGGTVTIKPSGTPTEEYRFRGPRDGNGYTFTTNAETGELTVKAPVATGTGDGVRVTLDVLRLVEQNGEKVWTKIADDTVSIRIKAGGNNNANTYNVSYDELIVPERQSKTANRKGNVPAGTTFAVLKEPDGYTVSVDANGNVTVKPAQNLGAGSTNVARIKVTYPDGSYEYADVQIKVSDEKGNTTPAKDRDQAKYEPKWNPKTMRGDEPATAERIGSVPSGTTFTLREDLLGNLSEYLTLKVANNGNVTATPKAPLNEGVKFNVPVQVTYPDGSSETKYAPFSVTQSGQWQKTKAKVSYSDVAMPSDEEGTAVPTKENVPAGTKFELRGEPPAGWTIDVDESTGVVKVKAPAGTRAGSNLNVPIRVTFPDGSNTPKSFWVNLTAPKNPTSDTANVQYKDTIVRKGETISITPQGLPAGAKVSAATQTVAGYTYSINAGTGVVTVTGNDDLQPGTKITLPVEIIFADGSTKTVTFAVAASAIAMGTGTTPGTTTPGTTTPATTAPKTSETPTTTKPTSNQTSQPSTTTTTEPAPGTSQNQNPSPNPEQPQPNTGGSANGSSGSSADGSSTMGIVLGVLVALVVLIGGAIAALPFLRDFLPNLPF